MLYDVSIYLFFYWSRPWRGRRTTRHPVWSRPREKAKQTVDWTKPVCFCCTVWSLFGPVVCWFWKHVGRWLCHCVNLDICPEVTAINKTFCSSCLSVRLGSSTWRGWSAGWTWMSRWCQLWGPSCPVWASRAPTPFSPSYRLIGCWQRELLQLYRCLSSWTRCCCTIVLCWESE